MRMALVFFLCLMIQGGAQADTPPAASLPPPPALPLIEFPSNQGEGADLAVIISGAGGWAPLVHTLSKELAAHDLPVIGLNAQQYFWKARTPEEATKDLTATLRHYLPLWRRQEGVLIGYSMGAEVLPLLTVRLPPDLQRHLTAVVLISPGRTASFEFHLRYFLGEEATRSDLPVLPEILKVKDVPVLCLYGREEQISLCRDLPPQANLHPIELPGGHHFTGNYSMLAKVILENLRRLNAFRPPFRR